MDVICGKSQSSKIHAQLGVVNTVQGTNTARTNPTKVQLAYWEGIIDSGVTSSSARFGFQTGLRDAGRPTFSSMSLPVGESTR